MPVCYKYINIGLYEQNKKVIEEFMEQQKEFANIDRKIREKQLTMDDIIAYGKELADLSQAAQQNIYILAEQFGSQFCFSADSIIDETIEKNAKRGYYDEEPVKSPYSGYLKYIYEKVD